MGAYDFLPKPFEPSDLIYSTRRAVERHRLFKENKRLLRELQDQVLAQTLEISRGRQLMENIISHMGSGVLVTDRDGKIWMINNLGQETLGVSGTQMVGKRIQDLFPGTPPGGQGGLRPARVGSHPP
jgi:signal transduction histidine kinase